MLEKLEEMQMKDTLRMFNGLVERCFSECVNEFRGKARSSPEDKCITTCANKFLKHSVRAPPARARRAPRARAQLATRPLARAPRREGSASGLESCRR